MCVHWGGAGSFTCGIEIFGNLLHGYSGPISSCTRFGLNKYRGALWAMHTRSINDSAVLGFAFLIKNTVLHMYCRKMRFRMDRMLRMLLGRSSLGHLKHIRMVNFTKHFSANFWKPPLIK